MPEIEETLRSPARDDGVATKGDYAGPHDDVPISLGVEEELFLVDPKTRNLVVDPDIGIFETCERDCGPHKVVREFIRSQIETNTRVCQSIAELRTAICELRRIVTLAAENHGVAAMAVSTHPFAKWREMEITPKERYHRFAMTFQEGVRRFIIGGTHIHIGFDNAGHAHSGHDRHQAILAPASRAIDVFAIQLGIRHRIQIVQVEPDRRNATHRNTCPDEVLGRIRVTGV